MSERPSDNNESVAEHERRGKAICEYAVSYLYAVEAVTGVTRNNLVTGEV